MGPGLVYPGEPLPVGAVGAPESVHAATNNTTVDKAPASISRKVRSIVHLKR